MSYELILEPGRSERNYWHDLWNYRELFWVLAQRDISVRYKQTVIGVAWALIRPLLTMIVFTVVFGRIAKLPSEGQAPYALMVFAGMLPWTFFSTSVGEAATSLISNANLVTKIYFPRLIIPAATVMVSLVDLLVSFGLMGLLMAWYGFSPGPQIFFLPLFVVLSLAGSAGLGAWFSAMNVKYRDFRYIVPFAMQLGLYVSPVGFSSSVIPEKWRLLYDLNPMVGVIDGFRWSLLAGQSPLDPMSLEISLAVSLTFLVLGLRKFRKTEKLFADHI